MPEDGERPAATVTVPPARSTPFCQAMIDLGDRLENDPPDDPVAVIIETYAGIQDEVPAAIREDFDAVLAELRDEDVSPSATSDAAAATTSAVSTASTISATFFEEGYDPDDDPALRLNAFVDFECRDVANNPGPPATQPLGEPTTP